MELGDDIICISSKHYSGEYTMGKKYIVYSKWDYSGLFITVADDNCNIYICWVRHFITLTEYREKILNDLII